MVKKSNQKQAYLSDDFDKNAWQKYINIGNLKIARENVGWSTIYATNKIFDTPQKKDRVAEWENGESIPTWKQLEKIGKKYDINFWFFLGKEVIAKEKDIPKFRSDNKNLDDLNLKKFIHYVRNRQSFLSEAVKSEGIGNNSLVGSGKRYDNDPVRMAEFIRHKIGYEVQVNKKASDVLKYIRSLLEENGVFVFKTLHYVNYKIDANSMKGMYIGDKYAPVIVLNRDSGHSKEASIFTFAHEIAHLFLNDSKVESVSFRNGFNTKDDVETFCNEVAANLILPVGSLEEKEYNNVNDIKEIAKKFGVTSIFIFHRLKNLGYINSIKAKEIKSVLDEEYKNSKKNKNKKEKGSGGSSINNMKDSNGALLNEFILNLYFKGKVTPFEAEKILGVSLNKL